MIATATVMRSLASALIVALLLAAPLIAHELLADGEFGRGPATGVSVAAARP